MSTDQASKYLSPTEYLEIERAAEFKSEYFDGVMYAMSGASRHHNRANVDLTTLLNVASREANCEVYSNDMRTKIESTGAYVYPDIVMTCEEPRFEDDQFDVLLNPQLMVEVLSPSTEKFDRGRKLDQYLQIPSLREYLIVAQEEPLIVRYRRDADDDEWRIDMARGMDASVRLQTIDLEVPLAEVYRRVEFPEAKGSPHVDET